ncbi:MAG TPA: hypothetical protein PLQ54_13015 [Armatimonadota bacterium]|nr:hypothetical protein [Armatimonadota bacterium]
MRFQNWSVIIAMVVMVLLAASTYYRSSAQAAAAPVGRALGFEVIQGQDDERFFAVLMADPEGALRVDVYREDGTLAGQVGLTQEQTTSAPVRILPE